MVLAKMAVAAVVALGAVVARGQEVGGGAPAMAEVRSEVSVVGAEVRVKQVVRWGVRDNAFFAGGLSELVVARFSPGERTVVLELGQVREVLRGAGVHPGELVFRGATKVTVTRLDAGAAHAGKPAKIESRDLDEFLDKAGAPTGEARDKVEGAAGKVRSGGGGAEVPRGSAVDAKVDERAELASSTIKPLLRDEVPGVGATFAGVTLREALIREVTDRLGLKAEDIEIVFDPADERVLKLAGPTFGWSLGQTRLRNLGPVTWSVTLWTESEKVRSTRRVEVVARVRAWQTQVVTRRGLSAGQLVRDEDVEVQRVLVEKLAEERLLSREQVLTMQASKPIAPGTVLAVRMLDPVLLVRSGQLVSVLLRQGGIEVRAVAKAVEAGAYGQTIRVRNEQTNDVFQVTVVGPQEAKLGPGALKEE